MESGNSCDPGRDRVFLGDITNAYPQARRKLSPEELPEQGVPREESSPSFLLDSACSENQRKRTDIRDEYRIPQQQPGTGVVQYGVEITSHFLEAERYTNANRMYLPKQQYLRSSMRVVLIDWLSQVSRACRVHISSFFLAVDIIDRYLSCRLVLRKQFQLVGITALLIATKYEEIWPLSVSTCARLSAGTYSNEEVITMELEIASTLRFKFTVPTVYPLACFFLQPNSNPRVHCASFFFLEIAAHCYDLLKYLPSRVALACVLLGGILIDSADYADSISALQFWNTEMQLCSIGISYVEICPIVEELLAHMNGGLLSRCPSVLKKYRAPHYFSVSLLPLPDMSIFA